MDIDPEKAWSSPFLAGALGALVALKGTPGASWWERVVNVISGALIAGYLSPAAAEFFALDTPAKQSGMAFACGLLGMNLVAMVVGWTKTLQLSDVLPWMKGKGQ